MYHQQQQQQLMNVSIDDLYKQATEAYLRRDLIVALSICSSGLSSLGSKPEAILSFNPELSNVEEMNKKLWLLRFLILTSIIQERPKFLNQESLKAAFDDLIGYYGRIDEIPPEIVLAG